MIVMRLNAGAPWTRQTVVFDEDVLCRVRQELSVSSRTVVRSVGVSYSTILQVLHENHMILYHARKVHVIGKRDYMSHVTFCKWFFQENVHQNFTFTVLFTDEAHFARDGIFNRRNSHV
ncbi:hypothetical protein PR048_013482 [Dryococelus australis]|uniref:Transposase n=1 Tax=Dryococelus australis TaxID=614101 RepID=A0ABQ9HSA4_9NEOP|nr:hypothetical protein PR048_013482 [Dryococelus australis]